MPTPIEDTNLTQEVQSQPIDQLQVRYSQACAQLGELLFKGSLIFKEISQLDTQAGEIKKAQLSKVPSTQVQGEAS